MAIGSKVSGNFKSASGLFAKVNGGWKKAQFGYIKVAGEWKQFWADKLEDDFGRTNTQSGLGAALSGQAWTVLRSLWQINNNAANTTGTKTDYPLANVDLGFLDFTLEANELTPGTGVAIRVENANNWIGVMPFYNQTSTAYTYCVSGYNQQYCINLETCYYQEAICYTGTYQVEYPAFVDDCCRGIIEYEWTLTAEGACSDPVTIPGDCRTVTKYEWVYVGGSRGVIRVPYEDEVCDDPTVVPGDCEPDTYEYLPVEVCDTANPCYVPASSDTYCNDGDPNNMQGYSLYYPVKCGCAFFSTPQYGTEFICTQTATGFTYNNFYYIRVVRMVNGVLSVVSDTAVSERWSALKITGDGVNLTVRAYNDSLYANQVGTVSFTNTTAVGTGYGIVSIPSNFEDGRTIGSIKVLPLGQ